jgi:hypothetical protein
MESVAVKYGEFLDWLKNVVRFLLGNSSASEFYVPTFGNILSVPSS